MNQSGSIFTLANFNLQNFNALLKKEFSQVTVRSAEYGQLLPFLLSERGDIHQGEVCICWLTWQDIAQAKKMNLDLADLIFNLKQSFQYVIVILPFVDSQELNNFQKMDARGDIYQFNFELNGKISRTNMILLDPTPWFINQGSNGISSALWYLSKTPFHKNIFKWAAEASKSALDGMKGKNRKVLIVDLDDTLWGGIVGDDGIENLKIGGHDPYGEAFHDFQKHIKELQAWGIILCICSKNDEATALRVFEAHDGMVLKKDDFVTWRINWNDKADNIADIVKELNVGMDSVVFLDDNVAERNRIKTAFPDILVPDLPNDKMEYPTFIRSLGCFNKAALSNEDSIRTTLYKDEKRRDELKQNFASTDEWIESLKMEIKFETLNEANLLRAVQLMNKTNQMNLRTRRLNGDELKDWAAKSGNSFYTVTVTDIFGENGITGLIGFHKTPENSLFIDDFVMSCRIMGRKVEYRMLDFIMSNANGEMVIAEYLRTDKNKPVLEFFSKLQHPQLQFSF